MLDALRYAEDATNYHNCSYNDFREKWLKKYCKQGVDTSVIKKADKLLADQSMKDAYCKLSSIPVVALGDGIGRIFIGRGKYGIDNKCLYERFNIRVIIVSQKDKEYIKNLIDQINHKIAKSVMYLTREEICDFEDKRNPYGNNFMFRTVGTKCVPCSYKNSFVHDFLEAFEDKLTFSFSDQFDIKKVKKKELLKQTIGGKHEENSSTLSYYHNSGQPLEATIDDIDYSVVFTESSQSSDHVLDEQLIDSVKSGDIEKVKSLLDGGANPNATSFNHALSIGLGVKGNTLALGYAIYFGHTEIAKLLINRGACINRYSCSSGKKSHLANAAEHLCAEIIELLLKQGADVDVQDSQGETPISFGLRSNIFCYDKVSKIDVLFIFLVHGATLTEDDRREINKDPNLQDCLTAFRKIKSLPHFGKLIESNKNGDTSVIFQYIGNENNAQELIEEFQNIKKDYGFQKGLSFIPKRLLGFLECVISKRDTGVAKNGYDDLEIGEEAANTLLGKLKEVVKEDNSQSETNSVRLFSTSKQTQYRGTIAKVGNAIPLPKKAENKPSKAIKTAVICGVIAALTVGVGFGIANVGLSTLDIAGIAVAAALVVGIVAFAITYAVSRPSEKLNETCSKAAFAQPTRSPFFS